MIWFLKFIFGMELYMFRTVSLSIIRSPALYTQQNLHDTYQYNNNNKFIYLLPPGDNTIAVNKCIIIIILLLPCIQY